MKIKKYIIIAAATILPLNLFGQVICNFESQDYDSLKVFDEWANSPFNQKKLEGNIAVVSNTIKGPADSTANILALQRSRYGSNIFGAKIRLKTPFELTTTPKYVHFLINKPFEGRVMLVGLGKRIDNPGQSDQVVQFHSSSLYKVPAGQWTDVVCAIKGNGGIMISSLVIVPDCESPHSLTADYITYIDDIIISNSPAVRYKVGDYLVNIDETSVLTRTDRHMDVVKFSGNSGGKFSATALTTGPKLAYRKLTDSVGFAVPGETITPTITYVGNWMHGYAYLDYMNDGKFDITLNANGTPATASDVAAYSYYSGKNSKGATPTSQNPGVNPPTFSIPAAMPFGVYRLRYKVDWDNIDAGGNINEGNTIIANGGGIFDVLLNIHKTTSHVKVTTRNGDVLHADNSAFAETDIPFGQPVVIVLKPEVGFKQNGVSIKHGYLTNDEFIHGNRQWRIDTIPAAKFIDNKYTIPSKIVDGDMEIVAEFAELAAVSEVVADPNLQISTSQGKLNVAVKTPIDVQIYDLKGSNYFSGRIDKERKFALVTGVYLINKQKVLVP